MNQTMPPSPDPLPALDPSAADGLARLTRDYARLAEGMGGASSLLGGAFLLLVAAAEFAGHDWRLAWLGALARPLPLPSALGVTLLPFIWLAARVLLRRWATARYGLVEPVHAPIGRIRSRIQAFVGRILIPGILLLGLVPTLGVPMSHRLLRASILVFLAAAWPFVFRTLRTRLERATAVLLFLAPMFCLAGIRMAATDSLLAYPAFGIVQLARGLRDQGAFRRVRRELDGAGGRP
jgi:hypothetical protein